MWPGELDGFALLDCKPGDLPTGVLVGKARITHVVRDANGRYEWHLAQVSRLPRHRKPTGHPQPVWFEPFGGNEER